MEINFVNALVGLLFFIMSTMIGATSSLCVVENDTKNGKDLTIAVLLPRYPCRGLQVHYPFFLQMAGPAISIALQSVESTLLSERDVKLKMIDTECELASAQFSMIDLMFNDTVHVVLGPGMEYVVSAVGRLLAKWGIPQITAGGLAAGFMTNGQRASDYSTLTRVQGPYKKMAGFTSRYFSNMGWNHSIMIFFDNEKVTSDCRFGVGPIYNLNLKAGLTGTSYKQIDGKEEDFTYQQTKDLLLNTIRPVSRGKTLSLFFFPISILVINKVYLWFVEPFDCFNHT